MIQDIGRSTFHVYMYCLYHSMHMNLKSTLSNIHVPTLLVHGKRDGILSYRHSVEMSKLIPNAELHLFEHTDHVVVLNNVTELISLIKAFQVRSEQ